jgi:hypothetical protein
MKENPGKKIVRTSPLMTNANTPEEIDAQIKHLMAKKEALSNNSNEIKPIEEQPAAQIQDLGVPNPTPVFNESPPETNEVIKKAQVEEENLLEKQKAAAEILAKQSVEELKEIEAERLQFEKNKMEIDLKKLEEEKKKEEKQREFRKKRNDAQKKYRDKKKAEAEAKKIEVTPEPIKVAT